MPPCLLDLCQFLLLELPFLSFKRMTLFYVAVIVVTTVAIVVTIIATVTIAVLITVISLVV